MKKLLEDKIAIITGSSGGLGQAVAVEMAKNGAKVVINYHSSADGADETLRQVTEYSSGIIVQGNVAEEADIEKLIHAAVSEYGRLDIMVNNSGIQKDASFLEMDLKKWQQVIDVNLTGQYLGMRHAALQFMKQDRPEVVARGKIICMSSVHDMIPWAGHVNYAASKGGVLMLMKSVAQELAPHGIRVNAISPGAIQTDINKSVWSSESNMKELMTLIPYKRIGKPQDVGKAAVWLASDESDYVNGETLYIDGGMMLYPEFADNG